MTYQERAQREVEWETGLEIIRGTKVFRPKEPLTGVRAGQLIVREARLIHSPQTRHIPLTEQLLNAQIAFKTVVATCKRQTEGEGGRAYYLAHRSGFINDIQVIEHDYALVPSDQPHPFVPHAYNSHHPSVPEGYKLVMKMPFIEGIIRITSDLEPVYSILSSGIRRYIQECTETATITAWADASTEQFGIKPCSNGSVDVFLLDIEPAVGPMNQFGATRPFSGNI